MSCCTQPRWREPFSSLVGPARENNLSANAAKLSRVLPAPTYCNNLLSSLGRESFHACSPIISRVPLHASLSLINAARFLSLSRCSGSLCCIFIIQNCQPKQVCITRPWPASHVPFPSPISHYDSCTRSRCR